MATKMGLDNRLPENESTGLTQIERVVDAYVAPTKTFMDVRRNASWWLPFVLGIIVSLFFVYAVDRQIGFDQVAQANINRSTSGQQRMSSMPEAQREQTMHTIANFTRIVGYAYPLVGLIFALIGAAILMASFNFGLGARGSFQQYLAVWFYAGLPYLLKFILAAISIFAGASAEQFDMRNPVGTNIGWYLTDVPVWLRTVCSSVDVFTIWVVVLLVLGCATVARVKRSNAAVIVVGWWLLIVIGGTVIAAFQG